MDTTLVRIRLLQAKREVGALGVLYTLLFGFLAAAGSALAYVQYQKVPNAFVAAGVVVAVVAAVQLSRADREFVFRHVRNPRLAIFSEYLVFTLPFTLPCLLSAQWYCFPAVAAAFAIIAGLRWRTNINRTALPGLWRLISPGNFEWISGIRKGYAGIGLVYLLGLGFCWLPWLPLFLLWVLTLVITGFYHECEGLPLLRAVATTPVLLLRAKLMRHSAMLLVLCVPVLAAATAFNPHLWLVHLILPVLLVLILACAILIKYATYEPNRKHPANALLIGFAAGGALLPFLLPVPFFICIRYWYKARQQLSFYLYD